MVNPVQIEEVLDLWHLGVGAAEIGRRFGKPRDWARRIVRKAEKVGDHRARPHASGNVIGAERDNHKLIIQQYYEQKQRE